jgi:hypothetical protein
MKVQIYKFIPKIPRTFFVGGIRIHNKNKGCAERFRHTLYCTNPIVL